MIVDPDQGTISGKNGKTKKDPFDRSAFRLMRDFLRGFGLGGLAPFVRELMQNGVTDSASIMLELQSTDQWKKRFAGNELLKANGFGVLSPEEYLAVEKSYAQVMRNYGLPSGFYDDPADFANFIGNNVSASELQDRVSVYADLANREDPALTAQLRSMGITKGKLLAYMIDPDRATPLIQRDAQTALLGAAARRNGLVADNKYLTQLAARGVSEDTAQQGYGLIAENLDAATTLGSIYGTEYGQADMEAEIFDSSGAAANRRKRLASQERAAFSGSAGVGSLTRSSAGSY